MTKIIKNYITINNIQYNIQINTKDKHITNIITAPQQNVPHEKEVKDFVAKIIHHAPKGQDLQNITRIVKDGKRYQINLGLNYISHKLRNFVNLIVDFADTLAQGKRTDVNHVHIHHPENLATQAVAIITGMHKKIFIPEELGTKQITSLILQLINLNSGLRKRFTDIDLRQFIHNPQKAAEYIMEKMGAIPGVSVEQNSPAIKTT